MLLLRLRKLRIISSLLAKSPLAGVPDANDGPVPEDLWAMRRGEAAQTDRGDDEEAGDPMHGQSFYVGFLLIS